MGDRRIKVRKRLGFSMPPISVIIIHYATQYSEQILIRVGHLDYQNINNINSSSYMSTKIEKQTAMNEIKLEKKLSGTKLMHC